MPEDERPRRREIERGRFEALRAVSQHYAAYLDGQLVGFGRGEFMDGGIALMGGAVRPEARGRGVYRALVHARWEHAVQARDTAPRRAGWADVGADPHRGSASRATASCGSTSTGCRIEPMATTEANTELGRQIVEDAKKYVLYSWSVQNAINPIAVERAEGRYFWDYDGKRYLDFASQLVNVSIGHSHPKIVQAIKDQAETLATIGPPMATESRSRLGKLLAEVTPGDLTMSFFTNGGAEANENAIKLARWYTGRDKIIARYRSYHGATAGSISLTGDPRRWPAEPGIPGVVRMFDPYTYRCPAGHPDPCPVCTGGPHLEEILQYEGAHTVAAVILETVTGTNGVIVPPDGYLQSIREVCDRHGILLIADEVMAGFGRTGKWFAVDNWDVVPDIMTVAKGINSGYVPLGAMVVREPIADWVRDKPFAGGLTYSGHPLACASGVASIEAFQEEGIVENAARDGRGVPRRAREARREAPVDRRGARARLLLGPRARQESRHARAARAVQRLGRCGEADGGADEARARPRPVSDDALERRHVLPAADDHARGARRGDGRARRRALGRR